MIDASLASIVDGYHRLNFWFYRNQFSMRKRVFIYTGLQRLMSNGVMLNVALLRMYEVMSDDGRKEKTPQVMFLRDALFYLSNGSRFSEALYDWMPYREASLIEAGEAAGDIVGAIDTTLHRMRRSNEVAAATKKALIYPAVLIGSLGALLSMVSFFLVPTFESAMRGQADWTGSAAILKLISDFTTNYSWILLLLLWLAVVALAFLLPRWNGKARTWLDRYPPFSLYRLLYGATFISSLASMMKHGISMNDALERMKKRANPWMEERIDGAIYGLQMGNNLGVALENAGHDFPDRLAVKFIRVLSEQRGFDEALEKYGDQWLEDSLDLIQRVAKVLGNIALIIVACLMVAVIAGLFDIYGSITTAIKQ